VAKAQIGVLCEEVSPSQNCRQWTEY